MPSTHDIANQVHSLALYDRAVDFSPIKEAIEIIEAERTRRALKAVADLEASKPQHRGRRFLVAWQDGDGALHTTHGIAYIEKRDENARPFDAPYGVLVDDRYAPFSYCFHSMEQFRAVLDGRKLPYAIVYLDEHC